MVVFWLSGFVTLLLVSRRFGFSPTLDWGQVTRRQVLLRALQLCPAAWQPNSAAFITRGSYSKRP